MLKYGLELLLWTETFSQDSIPLIGRAKELGFDGVEIHLRYPDRIPIEETKRVLKETGMGANFAVILTE